MTLITTGNLICNDTPQAPAISSLPDGLYQRCAVPSEDEASGVCSRDLVQLSQNLEIILSPGEKGYDFLVVDRNQARGRRRCTAVTPTNSTSQTSTTTLLRPHQHYHHGRGWLLVINAVTTVPLPSSNIAGAYGVSFAVATDIESELITI